MSTYLLNNIAAAERRRRARYTIALNARYRTVGRRKGRIAGIARTQNVSSGGVLLLSQHELPVGTRVDIAMEWPFLLNGATPLQLTARGTVVRCQARLLAVQLENVQFRTLKRRPEQIVVAAANA